MGAYELAKASGEAAVTIFATGSEVEIALAARDAARRPRPSDPRRLGALLRTVREAERRLPRRRSSARRRSRSPIEAGVRQGWDRFIGTDGIFIGMTGFGASGTIEQLYPHFGITAEAAAKAAEARLHK